MQAKKICISGALTLLISAGVAMASSNHGTKFKEILRDTDCERVSKEQAFKLLVLDRSFPIASGYNFHGFDRGSAVFTLYSASNPMNNMDQYPNPSSFTAAVRQWSKSRASIYYSPESDESNIDAGIKPHGFTVIRWGGLTVYYKMKEAGHTVKTKIYQALLHAETDTAELRITAGSPQLIADIVACAQEVSE